ncbi:hypothetical protein Ahy_A09g045143 [Arachis hypogaea]|uniref:Aminotransferase-like plant mobile domain-containing protein n=1 Tax=Arachis hypogaea TaxID=3818 RepID=A0A445BLN7_ARAHY|nr:hypothetical protein Ahy_A09g045143 [Arachis hypogaea]
MASRDTHVPHAIWGTITLQDVAYQFGLHINGFSLMVGGKPACEWFEELFGELPPEDCIEEFIVSYGWFQNKFIVTLTDTTEAMVQVYACGYIMMLLSTMLFGDNSGARVHLQWLPYVAGLNGLGKYSWSSATLSLYSFQSDVKNLAVPLALLQSWIFWRLPTFRTRGFDVILWLLTSRWGRYMSSSDEKGLRVIATRHRLDILRVDDFIWMPYNALEIIQVVHLDILRPEHTHLWKLTTALIYFSSIEWQ